MMSWMRDFVAIAIIGLFSLFLPFALMGMGVNDYLAFILGFSSCPILWHLYFRRGGRKWLLRYEEWKKTAAEMGLEELSSVSLPQVVGYHRNHRVRILEDPDSGVVNEDDQRHTRTLYIVEFENPREVLMYLIKRFSLPVIFHGHTSIESYTIKKNTNDTRVGDPEFDQRFVVRWNKETHVGAVLDQSIRKKMLDIENFYEVAIGYTSFLSRDNGLLTRTEMEPDEAHYIDTQTLAGTKGDAERFRAIIDTMIDIVEKIEAYTPSA